MKTCSLEDQLLHLTVENLFSFDEALALEY